VGETPNREETHMTTTTTTEVVEYGVLLDGTTHVVEVLHRGVPFSRLACEATDDTIGEKIDWIIEDFKSEWGHTCEFTVGNIWKVAS
jgi:hypothetical protein